MYLRASLEDWTQKEWRKSILLLCDFVSCLASFNNLQCAATVVSGLTAEYLPA